MYVCQLLAGGTAIQSCGLLNEVSGSFQTTYSMLPAPAGSGIIVAVGNSGSGDGLVTLPFSNSARTSASGTITFSITTFNSAAWSAFDGMATDNGFLYAAVRDVVTGGGAVVACS